MKVYIPSHLRKIEVVDQIAKMIQEYASNYHENTTDSFDDYYYSLKNDPVKKFLNLCISEDSIGPDQNYEDVINYLSRMFYSVKGTIKVFDYMKAFLGLNFEGDIVYTTEYIEFNLTEISLSDENLFYESLKGFLDALLYYQELRTNIGSINLMLTGDIENYIGSNLTCYNKFVAEPFYENNN